MPRDSLMEAYRMMKEATSVLPNPKNLGPGMGQANQHTDPVTKNTTMRTQSSSDAISNLNAGLRAKTTGQAPTVNTNVSPAPRPAAAPNSGSAPPPKPATASDNVTANKPGTPDRARAQAAALRGFGKNAGGGNYAKKPSTGTDSIYNKGDKPGGAYAKPTYKPGFRPGGAYSQDNKGMKGSPLDQTQGAKPRVSQEYRLNKMRQDSKKGTNAPLDPKMKTEPEMKAPMAQATNQNVDGKGNISAGGVGSSFGKQSGSGTTIKKPGDAQAATPPAKPAAKQTFGQAFAAARKQAGGAGGKFTYNGKEYQTNVKGEKYKKASKLKAVNESSSLFKLVKEVINETRAKTPVHGRTEGDLASRAAFTKKKGQQNMGGGSRYHNNSMAAEEKDTVVTKSGQVINFDPEKREMNGYN
jgi:hypothetical protein